MFLLDDILVGVVFLGKTIKEAAESELYDLTKLRARLVEVQERWYTGEIGEAEFRKEEENLLSLIATAHQKYGQTD
ncbi:MAG: gas vesicle protein GvpG [Cyanobacteria bacterium NC_groundwater_1444_Ag_S-0.65um_54_12]|nr:gas vesicle protein GvpG [Cyanobacteria bacterium NC_groundwater_1444_Ag_S-0.65um_54_12]